MIMNTGEYWGNNVLDHKKDGLRELLIECKIMYLKINDEVVYIASPETIRNNDIELKAV
jgi:hypothetical protein